MLDHYWRLTHRFGRLTAFNRRMRRLDAVQRRFTKKLVGLYTLTYTERLELLGLERLESR